MHRDFSIWAVTVFKKDSKLSFVVVKLKLGPISITVKFVKLRIYLKIM